MLIPKAYLDIVLVPTGLLFLGVYHLYLLYRILKHPHSTAIGFENDKKRIWVHKMMEGIPRNTEIALTVISSNISAATYLAGLSISLSSVIGTIVGSSTTSSQSKILANQIIYGDRSTSVGSVKYASLLLCFLTAFMSQVQCIRYYTHVSFLISTPGLSVPVHYVEDAVIRGSNFWSLGLRAYYFAFPLLLWVFGPIPMFTCSLGMVCFLYFLDSKDNPIAPFGVKEHKTVLDINRKGQVTKSDNGHPTLASFMMQSPPLLGGGINS